MPELCEHYNEEKAIAAVNALITALDATSCQTPLVMAMLALSTYCTTLFGEGFCLSFAMAHIDDILALTGKIVACQAPVAGSA